MRRLRQLGQRALKMTGGSGLAGWARGLGSETLFSTGGLMGLKVVIRCGVWSSSS